MHGKASFLDYLLLSRQRAASDPRDHVYGVLGLTRPRLIRSDYKKTVQSVYREVVEKMIVGDGNLNILSACCELQKDDIPLQESDEKSEINHNEDSIPALPSWIPNWRVPFHQEYAEYQVFPLCDGPYSAGGAGRPEIKYDQNSSILTICGIFLDSIAVVSNDLKTTRWQQVSEDWATWSCYNPPTTPYGDLEGQREAFRETFYVGLYSKDNPRTGDGGQEFFDIAVERKGSGGVTKEQLGKRTFGKAGRRFFSTENGRMGRGAHGVEVGDFVVVFVGAKVPFIIRKSGEAIY